MHVSPKGRAEILSHEAIVLDRYKDSVGVLTIGVGHTAAAGPPDPRQPLEALTVDEAVALFARDLPRYDVEVERAVKVPLEQHEFDALVSFHFNTGAIGKAAFVKKLNAGDRAGAAKGMMAWRKPAEIIPRRQKEQELFRDGIYSGDGKVSVYRADKAGRVQWKKGKRVSIASLTGRADPAPKPAAPQMPAPKRSAAITDEKTVSLVQTMLRNIGYAEVGQPNGQIGEFTKTAVLAFRSSNGLPPGDHIDDELISALVRAEPRKLPETRTEATPAEVREKVPEAKASWQGKVAGLWTAAVTGVSAVVSGAMDYLGDAKGYLEPVREFAGDVPGWVWFAAVGIGAFALSRVLQKGEAASVEAFQEGARR
jgi:GH24 family phage-related lysozyme (muramidase)